MTVMLPGTLFVLTRASNSAWGSLVIRQICVEGVVNSPCGRALEREWVNKLAGGKEKRKKYRRVPSMAYRSKREVQKRIVQQLFLVTQTKGQTEKRSEKGPNEKRRKTAKKWYANSRT